MFVHIISDFLKSFLLLKSECSPLQCGRLDLFPSMRDLTPLLLLLGADRADGGGGGAHPADRRGGHRARTSGARDKE